MDVNASHTSYPSPTAPAKVHPPLLGGASLQSPPTPPHLHPPRLVQRANNHHAHHYSIQDVNWIFANTPLLPQTVRKGHQPVSATPKAAHTCPHGSCARTFPESSQLRAHLVVHSAPRSTVSTGLDTIRRANQPYSVQDRYPAKDPSPLRNNVRDTAAGSSSRAYPPIRRTTL
ncbi:hypothetical protein BC830DRAFT_1170515 [Chytriomyces sp. MP71]|nr:hypothetical protein BC830DRAFT_1170515 [Chytriomyces sp. MP71]